MSGGWGYPPASGYYLPLQQMPYTYAPTFVLTNPTWVPQTISNPNTINTPFYGNNGSFPQNNFALPPSGNATF